METQYETMVTQYLMQYSAYLMLYPNNQPFQVQWAWHDIHQVISYVTTINGINRKYDNVQKQKQAPRKFVQPYLFTVKSSFDIQAASNATIPMALLGLVYTELLALVEYSKFKPSLLLCSKERLSSQSFQRSSKTISRHQQEGEK